MSVHPSAFSRLGSRSNVADSRNSALPSTAKMTYETQVPKHLNHYQSMAFVCVCNQLFYRMLHISGQSFFIWYNFLAHLC